MLGYTFKLFDLIITDCRRFKQQYADVPGYRSIYDICRGCHSVVSTNTRDLHLTKNQESIRSLLYQDWFWCENCSTYAIYDHFPRHECEMCN